jgi:hypothetical protein
LLYAIPSCHRFIQREILKRIKVSTVINKKPITRNPVGMGEWVGWRRSAGMSSANPETAGGGFNSDEKNFLNGVH